MLEWLRLSVVENELSDHKARFKYLIIMVFFLRAYQIYIAQVCTEVKKR